MKIIFSVYKNFTLSEALLYDNIAVELKATKAQGRYKGQDEPSLLVDFTKLNRVLQVCRQQDQESILILADDNESYLLFLKDMTTVKLGYFIEVSEDVALASDAFTRIENKYFTIEENICNT